MKKKKEENHLNHIFLHRQQFLETVKNKHDSSWNKFAIRTISPHTEQQCFLKWPVQAKGTF